MKLVALLLTLTGTVHAALPDTVILSNAEASALGVTTEQPRIGQRSVVLDARARVVLPPANEHSANSLYPGFVARLLVGAGDPVVKGQLLGEIKSVEFLEAQRQLLEARAEQQLSRDQLERNSVLFAEGIIARRRLDESRVRARSAETRFAELRQVLAISGFPEPALEALLETGVLHATQPVYSPITGIVLARLAGTGERVDALAPLYRIADLSSLWLDIRINQEDAPALAVGMPLAIESRDAIAGELAVIGSLVDPHTQTISVRGTISVAEGDEDADAVDGVQLRPDQFVQVRIFADRDVPEDGELTSAHLSVPTRALIRHESGTFVFVVLEGMVQVQPVTVAGYNNGRVNVTSGLRVDDRVAVTGVAALKALWLGGGAE